MSAPAPVDKVVVLMLENRSFDQLLGHLDHGVLVPVGPDDRNVRDVSDPAGEWISAHFLPSDHDVTVDPGHGFEDVVRQLTENDPPFSRDGLSNGGFAWNYARRLVEHGKDPMLAEEIMGCHSAQSAPVISTLAREFAVCTQWFSSVPSETWPNRLFAHGAQSDGLLKNVYRFYTHRTTFDAFNDAGVTWTVYAGDAPQTASYAELNDAFKDRFNLFGEFEEDVHDGTLPRYSFIEPRHFLRVNSQHPTHSVSLGDQLIRRVYTTLASNPEVWKSVLLIITWDEHGGFFDREKPPEAVPPVAGVEGDFGFKFDNLGVRVPAVVVSPFIPAGTVSDQVHDHSSIVRTALDALGVEEQLTERDARAASVLPLLTLDEPRSPPPLPAPPREISRAVAEQGSPEPVELDDLQRGLVELGGLLDAQRAPRRRRGAPPPPPPLETVTSPDEIELFVHHFQHEHIGNRAARLRLDAAVG